MSVIEPIIIEQAKKFYLDLKIESICVFFDGWLQNLNFSTISESWMWQENAGQLIKTPLKMETQFIH